MIRLDKFLCDQNLGTRSEVKKIIKSGNVSVDGEIIKSSDYKFDELKSIVTVKGKTVNYEKYGYYLFHKPSGCVTANKDNLHKTVMDYFPSELRNGYSPVGRLDLDTEGLLIITNDGDMNHHLISPNHHIPKTYLAYVDKPIPANASEVFLKGVDIGDDKPTLPAKLELIEQDLIYREQRVFQAKLTIEEGRFHQVKRMFHAIGCEVVYLKRLSMGDISLGDLPLGEYRKLSFDEVILLKK